MINEQFNEQIFSKSVGQFDLESQGHKFLE